MQNPFGIETKNFGKKITRGKNLGFDEAFLDLRQTEPEVLEDERESVNYRILGVVVGICLILLGVKVFALQGIDGSYYRALAEGNKLRTQAVLAPR